MDAIKYVLMGFGLMGLLLLGSCMFIGYSTVKAVDEATSEGSQFRKDLEASAKDYELKRHNERLNAESSYQSERFAEEEFVE